MKRFVHIDFLRAIAIVGVILVHTFFNYLTNPVNTAIWNYGEFVVGSFVFCSGYVLYFSVQKLATFRQIISWWKKRFVRILVPFYIYFLIHFLLTLLFPQYFSGPGMQHSWSYFINTLFLFGGNNTNWLPVLFLELAILAPFFLTTKMRAKWFVAIMFLVSICMTIISFPYSTYRLTMWAPWSLLFVVGGWVAAREKENEDSNKLYIKGILSSGIFFGGLFVLWQNLHKSLSFIDNKYPPNLFYIFYTFFGTFLVLLLSTYIQPFIPEKWYVYISRKSYGLFFIHFIVLDFFQKIYAFQNPFLAFIFVAGISIGLCIMWDIAKMKFLTKRVY